MNWKLKALVIGLGVIIVILLGIVAFIPGPHDSSTSSSQATSTANISPVASSSDGHVVVSGPFANDLLVSPVKIVGSVTGGGWFFEATFPVKIVDADGTVLGQGQARAQGDWMSTGTVPFSASVVFVKPHSLTGAVVLSKDNPSGLPQNAESFSIPVRFSIDANVPNSTSSRSATSSVFNNDSGVQGTVTLGPTCPVEKIPPDPQCAPQPYVTRISVYLKNSSSIITSVTTDARANFTVALPPGDYLLVPQGGNPFPRCASLETVVAAQVFTKVNLDCDTGIR